MADSGLSGLENVRHCLADRMPINTWASLKIAIGHELSLWNKGQRVAGSKNIELLEVSGKYSFSVIRNFPTGDTARFFVGLQGMIGAGQDGAIRGVGTDFAPRAAHRFRDISHALDSFRGGAGQLG